MVPVRHIAILIETSREYGRGLLRGVTRYHRERSQWCAYFEQQDLGASLPKWFHSWNGDGILARVASRRVASVLMKKNLPLIDLRGGTRELGVPAFGPDNRQVSKLAYKHLASCGLEHFGFVAELSGKHYYDDERCAAFWSFVERAGRKCHIFKNKLTGQSSIDWETHQWRLIEWLRQLPKPVGIMCCHDSRGPQVLDCCRIAGLGVPDEVAVIGVDNDEFLCGLAIPSLSSIDVNAERIGYEAATELDRMMDGKAKLTRPRLFPPLGVVARQSTDLVACNDPQVAKAIRLIRQQACDRLRVSDVEKQLSISRSLLNRRFKQVVGHSPKREILRIQIDAAKRLLLKTEMPIHAVSERVGFGDVKYFIAVFRSFTKSTPRAYRLAGWRTDSR